MGYGHQSGFVDPWTCPVFGSTRCGSSAYNGHSRVWDLIHVKEPYPPGHKVWVYIEKKKIHKWCGILWGNNMNRKKQLSFLKVPMSGTNCTFRISNSWTQTIILLMKSTRIIGSLRRSSLMWIKLRRYCFKCFHQRDSSLKGTIRNVSQSMLHWFGHYVRQSSIWSACHSTDWEGWS